MTCSLCGRQLAGVVELNENGSAFLSFSRKFGDPPQPVCSAYYYGLPYSAYPDWCYEGECYNGLGI